MGKFFKIILLLILAFSLVTFPGTATNLEALDAAKEKYFTRDGKLVVEEKGPGVYKRREDEGESYPVPPPPFSEGIYPCSECHEFMEVNTERRKLEDMHTDIVLDHAEGQRWCLDCHNPDNRDTLRLVSGEVIPFTESYRLCGQCHGDKFRDWRVGIHGKRTGYWNGEKQYLLCAHCHNPHDPNFKPMEPMPPPVRPENLDRQGAPTTSSH